MPNDPVFNIPARGRHYIDVWNEEDGVIDGDHEMLDQSGDGDLGVSLAERLLASLAEANDTTPIAGAPTESPETAAPVFDPFRSSVGIPRLEDRVRTELRNAKLIADDDVVVS